MARIIESIALKIDAPTGPPAPGRGFYQLEEDALYVPVGEQTRRRRFFSWLESERVRFDIDKSGRLMLLEVDCPRRQWDVDSNLSGPSLAEPADIRWLDFRSFIPDPDLLTNSERTVLQLRFHTGDSWRWQALAQDVLIQTDRDLNLAAVMVTGIEDDLAGRRIAAFRKRFGSAQPRPDELQRAAAR